MVVPLGAMTRSGMPRLLRNLTTRRSIRPVLRSADDRLHPLRELSRASVPTGRVGGAAQRSYSPVVFARGLTSLLCALSATSPTLALIRASRPRREAKRARSDCRAGPLRFGEAQVSLNLK